MAKEIVRRYLSDYAALSESGGSVFSTSLGEVRKRSIDRFAEVGFPSSRDEKWRFTNFSRLTEKHFAVKNGVGDQQSEAALDDSPIGWLSPNRVVFVDGKFSPKVSAVAGLPNTTLVGNLSTTANNDPTILEQGIAQIADSFDSPFTALNTAFFSEGGTLLVPDGVCIEEPIQFLFLTTSHSTDRVTHPRNMVIVGEGAEATVVETYLGLGDGSSWTNPVTEIVLGDAADLKLHRVQLDGKKSFHTATTQCRQGRDSNLTFSTVVFGGSLSRHDINFKLDGIGASCSLHGISYLRDRQHSDNQTTIEHAKPHCTSVEKFNGIYDDSSRGVFTGRVLVKPYAQQTDAIQSSRNLLLTETARADTQPQLEIFADDVKCTHGATVGPIDDEALFYLRSKGLTSDDARAMLTYGFAVEIIDMIGIKELREYLDAILRSRLDREGRDTRGEK